MKSKSRFSISGVVRINKRGQIVLPKELRVKADIKTRDKLAILACKENFKFFVMVKANDLAMFMCGKSNTKESRSFDERSLNKSKEAKR